MSSTRLIVVTDDTTADELHEALGHLNHLAQREFPVVGTEALATPWDRRHAAINALLDDLDLIEAMA